MFTQIKCVRPIFRESPLVDFDLWTSSEAVLGPHLERSNEKVTFSDSYVASALRYRPQIGRLNWLHLAPTLYTMGAPTKYKEQDLLKCALDEISEVGFESASVASVARRLGAPSGSVYHRYPTRLHLLGAVWVQATQRYQAILRRAFEATSPDAAANLAAAAVFGWLKSDPDTAKLMLRFRSEELIEMQWPEEIATQLAHLAEAFASQVNECGARLGVNPLNVILAMVDIPLASARRAAAFDNDVIAAACQERTAEASRALLHS